MGPRGGEGVAKVHGNSGVQHERLYSRSASLFTRSLLDVMNNT